MDKESKSGSGGFPNNGIVAVVLLAAGVLFVRESPLQTTRLPVNEPRLEQRYTKQDVDARLWQDPFSAVAKYRSELRKSNPDKLKAEDSRHAACGLVSDVARKVSKEDHKQPQILAVMLPGGPYSENVESRRRGRYAVLAALNASRLSPVDTAHLGYFIPAAACGAATLTPTPQPEPEATLDPIAYEWFEPAFDVRPKELSKSGLQSPVLVMWLQSEAFGDAPLQRMAELAAPFVQAGASWRVLGPNGSDGLKAMIDEAAGSNFKAGPVFEAMRFYSLNATVPDKVLLEGLKQKEERLYDVSKFFGKHDVALVRTIGDDGSLADELIKELGLRGLNPRELVKDDDDESRSYEDMCRIRNDDSPSQIAVVAEWDTLYGRSLRREFRAKEKESGFCVERFNYVRGLDGQLPAAGDSASGASASAKQGPADKDDGRRKDGTFIEVAEGQGQFDYLRRLAIEMRLKDERIRRSSADGQGFRAIGVLGNDVHDKLLVMQALRPEFPNTIFFTTDMDARLLHPREQAWARNLIVASNFGLRLRDSLQAGAPPFRDSYQVSAFLSTRLAVDDARRALQLEKGSGDAQNPASQSRLGEWFEKPRIFEIGRTEAFDFNGKWPKKDVDKDKCRGPDWVARCNDIHPGGSPRYPMPGVAVMFLISSLVVLALWVPPLVVNRRAKVRLANFVTSKGTVIARWSRWIGLALVLIAVQVALPLAMAFGWEPFAAWLTKDGKPIVAIEGISLWPTEALRVFTLLLCFYLLYRGWLMLTYSLEDIGRDFKAGDAPKNMEDRQDRADRKQGFWRKLLQVFSMRFIPPLHRQPRTGGEEEMEPEAIDFWGRHIVQNRLMARLIRTATCVVIAAIFSSLLMMAIGEPRFVPQRGDLSRVVHEGLRLPAQAMMFFLVFFVVDATVLCVRFVRGLLRLRRLHEVAANWPEATLKKFEDEMGIPRAYLENWIDLQFVARRTHCVTLLIYYPFVVISLWLLSRSAVFDHWTMSVGTVAPAAVGAAVALGCAVALRLAAEDSRAHALEQVKNAVSTASAKVMPDGGPPPASPSVEQLKLLQGRIENLHEGAFAPFWQQPLLKAVLLPFATLGGTTVLDYLALANI
ncbi:hypothetical protein QTH90_04325 [Variovorax sp. J2P1-59]|uniref:hypothetical protein n=1 Tax=Variovorax flavidus TaxID=3053501 RepID=UPI002578BE9F|nr:hypothetical protein [Variovorax sp. J2P1-59]MDM0073595.1 hypothetical protein [Variovorax sp. J2P1-59]